MTTQVLSSFDGPLCTLTLQPPEGKPPTLDHDVIAALDAELAALEARAGALRAVVIRSASPKVFCAGANLRVMETIDDHTIVPWVERGHRLMNRLESLPLPVIARVEGHAMGGGLELALACDLIFASTNARFAQSEARLGLITGWGGGFRLVRRVGLARAKDLALSGRLIDAAEAARIGLADWHGPTEELDRHLTAWVAETAANGAVAVREVKRLLAACATSPADPAALETAASVVCLREGDAPARIRAFLAGRKKRSG
jgi:enoyl-CoA hydratase